MPSEPTDDETLNSLRQDLKRRRWHPRPAKRIDHLVAELIAKRGYAREIGSAALEAAWKEASGNLASHSRPGNLRRGVLEVYVKSSSALQEFGFQKRRILKRLTQLAPEQNIAELKFQVGPID